MKVKMIFLFILMLLSSEPLLSQEKIDLQMMQRIRREGLDNSKVMEFMSYLCDIYGSRLAESPNYRRSAKWAAGRLGEMGLEKAQLEPWGIFGRGWELKKFYAAMTQPEYVPLIAYPKAWTPSTRGLISGEAVLLNIRDLKELEGYKGKLNGAIVFLQTEKEMTISFEPEAKRHTDEDLKRISQAPEPGYRSPYMLRREEYRVKQELQAKIIKFLKTEGAAVVVEPSEGNFGTLLVVSGGSYKKGAEESLPFVVVSAEQYNRMARILKKGMTVKMDIEVQASFDDSDSLGYNVIAEIPGTDKNLKDEIVMLGGHFDTWHSAPGATDNAAGCSIAMEAVRILKALGVKPRRTIRIAMWDAEEVGLLGSRNYVNNHFYDTDKKGKKTAYDKFSAYFNLDNGSGRIRGIYAQGNLEVMPVFEQWLKPFSDLGATTVSSRSTGSTDHVAFDNAGLPGFQFIQDPIHYMNRTHHTNMDHIDSAQKGDLMQASVVMAAFVYNAAMREERLPRKFFDTEEIRASR